MSVISAKCQALKEDLRRGIIDGKDTSVSFDDFPYYLSENTKSVLIASTFINLKRKDFTKYAMELPTVSLIILFSGPAGSEIYQKCKLVHGDLSKYNILYHQGHLYCIDVSQTLIIHVH